MKSTLKNTFEDEYKKEHQLSNDDDICNMQRSHAKIWDSCPISFLMGNAAAGPSLIDNSNIKQQDHSPIDDMLFSDSESTSL